MTWWSALYDDLLADVLLDATTPAQIDETVAFLVDKLALRPGDRVFDQCAGVGRISIPLADLQPGDLLFWASNASDPATIHHVALYAGDGLMVAAPHTGDVVKIQPIYLDGYIGAVRPGASLVG